MKALTFLIDLTEALLATQTQSGEANSAVSWPFIPGSMLRGAVIAAWLKKHKLNSLNMGSQKTLNLFFNGQTQYLNAYPADDKVRLLPRPLSWFTPKDETETPDAPIFDFAIQPQEWDTPAKAPAPGDFCRATDEGDVILKSPRIRITVHNASDERSYKSAKVSQVYRYEALDAGQSFAGVIIAKDEALLKDLQALLKDGISHLGGAYSAGYGGVKIHSVALRHNWQEYQEDAFKPEDDDELFFEENVSGERLILTCLSDLILRGSNGQTGASLAEITGCQPERIYQKTRTVGGFNRKWGLPLPQATAIQAGSVFVFSANCRKQLEGWVKTGVGERRAEGFGRVALNWHCRPQINRREFTENPEPVSAPKELSALSASLAQKMAQRQLQQNVEQALRQQINILGSDFRHLPRPTQLAGARLAARRAWMNKNLKEISDHFSKMTKLTQREWEDMRVAGEKFLTWVNNLSADSKLLSLPPIDTPTVAGAQGDFEALRVETAARLIEGVLRQAEKQAKLQAEGGKNV